MYNVEGGFCISINTLLDSKKSLLNNLNSYLVKTKKNNLNSYWIVIDSNIELVSHLSYFSASI